MDRTAWQRAQARARLISKFAALDEFGNVTTCTASPSSDGFMPRPKVIFPSQAYANRTAGALIAMGEDPQEPYLGDNCKHWHLRQQAKRRRREQVYEAQQHPEATA